MSIKKLWYRTTPEHIFIFSICLFISIPIIFNDSPSEGSCCVEVTLEKPEYPPEPQSKFPQLFNTGQHIPLSKKEFNCLARNIYWESLSEPLIGQLAVANITYNRLQSGKWGNTFCKVIFHKKQFSWTNNKNIRNAKPKNQIQWNRAKYSAMLFSRGVRVTKLEDSEFYYAQYINPPSWTLSMTKQAHLGQHIFFSNNQEK